MTTSNLFSSKSCINKVDKCNYIKPYSMLEYNNLGLSSSNIDEFNIQYNKKCSSNNGKQIETCNIDLDSDDLLLLTENEKTYYENFKRVYPFANLIYEKNDTNEKILEKIEFYRNKPDKSDYNLVKLTPYMLCKIKNSGLKKNPNGNNVYADSFLPDNYDNNCNNDIISLENIVGSNNVNLTKKYSYYDDIEVIKSIKSNIFESVKSYVLKYRTVDHPLTHDDYNNRLIHIASKYNNIRVLNFLISLKANMNIKNKEGDTALHFASKHNNIDSLNILLKNGANIKLKNNKGRSLLFNIVKNKNIDILNFIYNNGINIHTKDNDDNNLIHYSLLENPDYNIIRFLIDKNVSLQEKNNKGMLPIEFINSKIETDEVQKDEKLLLSLSSIQSYIYRYTNTEKNKFDLVNVSENVVEYPVQFDTMVCYKNTLSNKELNGNNKNSSSKIIKAKDEDDCLNKGGNPSNYKITNKEVSFQYIDNKQSIIDNIDKKELYLDKKGNFKDGKTYNTTQQNNIETFTNKLENNNINNDFPCRKKSLLIALLILGILLFMV